MATLTESQFDWIAETLRSQLHYGPLIDELADHVACATESYLASGYTFEEAYKLAITHFGPQGLIKTEKETLTISNPKLFRFMKTIRIILYVSYVLTAFGTFFKIMHWPSANELLVLGLGFISIMLLTSSFIKFEVSDVNPTRPKNFQIFRLFYFGGLSVLGIGVLFRILHQPIGSPLFYIGAAGIVFATCVVAIDWEGFRSFFQFNRLFVRNLMVVPAVVFGSLALYFGFLFQLFR